MGLLTWVSAGRAGSELADPFAREAKFLVERIALNRDVKVVLEGVDKYNNFFGSLKITSGSKTLNLAENLLSQGFAKCVEWSMKFAASPGDLRAAEKVAKEGRLRIFKDWVPPVKLSHSASSKYTGLLVEVKSGDTLIFQKPDGEQQQVTLSSVRCPRMGFKDKPYEPCSLEAREMVRQYIGKQLDVTIEYTRTLPAFDDGREGKTVTCGTVLVGPDSENLAVKLLQVRSAAHHSRSPQPETRNPAIRAMA